MPRTSIMQVRGDAPHNLHVVAGGFPAQPSCRCMGMLRTAFMHGQRDSLHSLHAGAGGRPAQPSFRCISREITGLSPPFSPSPSCPQPPPSPLNLPPPSPLVYCPAGCHRMLPKQHQGPSAASRSVLRPSRSPCSSTPTDPASAPISDELTTSPTVSGSSPVPQSVLLLAAVVNETRAPLDTPLSYPKSTPPPIDYITLLSGPRLLDGGGSPLPPSLLL